MRTGQRHARANSWEDRLEDFLSEWRPLDPVRSFKTKLAILIGATVAMYALVTWVGDRFGQGALRTLPVAIVLALLLVLVLSRGMTRPLREMTAAARAMARGDYSQRVRATSQDEVGELAAAFNSMASDLEGLDASRREMVANVSHELRTPVAALRAQLENMVDGVITADPTNLESALAQTERLSRLISYLLDLSRVDAGAAQLEVEDLPGAPYLEDVLAQASAGSGRADLTWKAQADPELHFRADSERLRQVLLNLLSNAARHSPPGGTITVGAEQDWRTQEVVLQVTDEGSGIPAAERARVFERFVRGTPRSRDQVSTGGTGLGLAISRWAVDLHHGSIAVLEPPSGGGTVIEVRLPQGP